MFRKLEISLITVSKTYVRFEDAKRAIAIGNDRPDCYKEWCGFEYASSNSTGSMQANLKKRRKLHEYVEQERFPRQERQIVVEEYEEDIYYLLVYFLYCYVYL